MNTSHARKQQNPIQNPIQNKPVETTPAARSCCLGVSIIERLSYSAVSEFLARLPFSVVHFDADWDGYRKAVADKIREIEPQFERTVSFGYMDGDVEQEYARKINIRNIPSVAYYRGAKLFGVVIGIQQDIAANIERLKRGELLDQTNAISRG